MTLFCYADIDNLMGVALHTTGTMPQSVDLTVAGTLFLSLPLSFSL